MSEQTQDIIQWSASIAMALIVFGFAIAIIITNRKFDREKENKKAS